MPLQLYDKDRILDACLVVFARHGYQNTSALMLADAAGISKALVFHHFKNKKELYLSVLARCFERAGQEMRVAALPEYPDFFTAMREFSVTKLTYYQQNPDVYRVVREAIQATPDDLKADIQARYGDLITATDTVWENLFEKVPLREGVHRRDAFELVMLTLDHFENQYLSAVSDQTGVDQTYLQGFLEKMNGFLDMVRYGVERK